jgi:hypothetical protein
MRGDPVVAEEDLDGRRSAGRSRASNTVRREPASFLNGRSLTQATRPAMAALASARLVKRRSRSRAMTQRSATSTATSTLALSRGL